MVRTGIVAIVALVSAAACTGSGTRTASHAPSSTAPPPPSETASPVPSHELDPTEGWLAIDVRSRSRGYDEGAIAFVELRDAAGGLVGHAHAPNGRLHFLQQVQPGTYHVRTFLRPCDGSCSVLDAATEECHFSIEMRVDGRNRLVIVRSELPHTCSVDDQGGVLEIN
jgi:hypothetical protein